MRLVWGRGQMQKRQQGTDMMELTDWLWAYEAPSRDAQKQLGGTLKGVCFWQPDLRGQTQATVICH